MSLTPELLLNVLQAASSQTSAELRKQGESQLEALEGSPNFLVLLQVCTYRKKERTMNHLLKQKANFKHSFDIGDISKR